MLPAGQRLTVRPSWSAMAISSFLIPRSSTWTARLSLSSCTSSAGDQPLKSLLSRLGHEESNRRFTSSRSVERRSEERQGEVSWKLASAKAHLGLSDADLLSLADTTANRSRQIHRQPTGNETFAQPCAPAEPGPPKRHDDLEHRHSLESVVSPCHKNLTRLAAAHHAGPCGSVISQETSTR
jgi:hypothetical protein